MAHFEPSVKDTQAGQGRLQGIIDAGLQNRFSWWGQFMSLTKPKLDDLRIERPDRAEPNARTWVGMAIVVGLVLLVGAAVWWWKRPKAIEVRTVVAREVSGGRADRTVLNASGYVT